MPSGMNYEIFRKDLKTRKAVERNITIIGEAMDRILKEKPDINITDARRIVDARNRIMHGYESVLPDIIWGIKTDRLPLLHKEVIGLLAE
jgi:uncharacterized protein with HEPN domain